MKTFVISLGGSLVCPKAGRVDIDFLKKFRALILKYVRRGHRFAIIVGGGKLAREWQEAARELMHNPPQSPLNLRGEINRDLDWVGIRATQLNAELVRAMFGPYARPELVMNPARKVSNFKILVGAGYVPGHSTDYDAVVRAKTLGAKTVINLSDVQYVYDKDPGRYKDAQPLRNLTWEKFFQISGTRQFTPGMNTPFDPTAAKFAARHDLRVVFMRGSDLKNFERFLQGQGFNGTIIV